MKNYIFIIFLCACWIISGCVKKEEPVLQDGAPVFNIEGFINNTQQQMVAGKNDYFMHTDYRVVNNTYEFVGDLKRTCTGCKESLRVIIRNFVPGTGNTEPDSAFYNGNYLYGRTGTDVSNFFLLTLNAEPDGNGTVSHLWSFGDGTFSTDPNPSRIFRTDRKYNISYMASFSGGCTSNLSFPVGINPYSAFHPDVTFTYSSDTFNQKRFTFQAVADSATAASFSWDFGDGQSDIGEFVIHEFDSTGIVRKVTLSYLLNNDTIEVAKNVVPQIFLNCQANFERTVTPLPNEFNLSTVTVEWTDANGTVYSSDRAEQNVNSSSFIITSSSPYIINDRGQLTRSLDVLFTCKVSDGSRVIELNNMKGHIAAAYP